MTQQHWLAVGILGAGGVGLLSMYLFAKGRPQEAFALSAAATLTSTIFAASRALAPAEPCRVTVGPSQVSYGEPTITEKRSGAYYVDIGDVVIDD